MLDFSVTMSSQSPESRSPSDAVNVSSTKSRAANICHLLDVAGRRELSATDPSLIRSPPLNKGYQNGTPEGTPTHRSGDGCLPRFLDAGLAEDDDDVDCFLSPSR